MRASEGTFGATRIGDVGCRLDGGAGIGRGVIGAGGVATRLIAVSSIDAPGTLFTPVDGRATMRPVLSMLAGRCAGR